MTSRSISRARPRWWQWRGWPAVLAGALLLGVLDQWAASYQDRERNRRRQLKDQLDRLSFEGLRTGIDEIAFDGSQYRIHLRLQNASRAPFFVLLPALEGYVQVGHGWQQVPVTLDREARVGAVMKLEREHTIVSKAQIDGADYAEPIAGYRHVRLTLEAYLSPEENPQEEIGERREEFFIFLRDVTRDGEFTGGGRQRPSFIPLRAWTLLPKEAL